MSKSIVTIDEVIETMSNALSTIEGSDLADLYNQLVEDGNLKYDGENFYTETEE